MKHKRSVSKNTSKNATSASGSGSAKASRVMPTPPSRAPKRARTINRQAEKRNRLRNQFWPESESEIWSRKETAGFTTIPRVLSLVAHLIRDMSESGDPSKAYLELWCSSFDEMIVTIEDEQRHAFAAGYTSNRALRTWQSHVWELDRLGFVRVQPEGNRGIGHVLLMNPYLVCARLHKEGRVDPAWWGAFFKLVTDTGANIPEA